MADKSQLQVGVTVYLRPVGNAVRYGKEIKRHIIKRIGRTYFETWDGKSEYSTIKFRLNTFRHENGRYSPNWIIYLSEQEILDEDEAVAIWRELKRLFDQWTPTLSLDKLRQIQRIVREEV